MTGSLTPEKLWQRYKPPAVVFPHGALGVSTGEPIWDLTQGKFGPFGEQLFVGDFTNLVIRVELQKIGSAYQGVAFPFLGRSEDPDFATGERLKQLSLSPPVPKRILPRTSGRGRPEERSSEKCA